MKILTSIFLLMTLSFLALGQTIDEPLSRQKMIKDLEIFKEIRLKANSGLYKYRSKAQIDSSYNWAAIEINNSTTYLDFYNIICQLTEFEGSSHNETSLPKKYRENLRKEEHGYFPFPIKWIEGKWLVNYVNEEVPLCSEIIEINGIPMAEVIQNLNKYYNTDGENTTGKRVDMAAYFSKYFRLHYGQQENFQLIFSRENGGPIEKVSLNGVSYLQYFRNFNKRNSKPYDQLYYKNLKENQKYSFKKLDNLSGVLTIGSFSLGNETTEEHKNYVAFLDSVFTIVQAEKLQYLIVDVRLNNGGDDPNDMVTYSYLTSRDFQESKEVWISFQKVPFLKHFDSPIPAFLRPLGVGKYNRKIRKRFSREEDGKFYISKTESEMKVRSPNKKAFTGNVILLTSPAVNSAGSLFAAMVAGNENTIVVGEETMGGYYGHNGHYPMSYVLPKSKIITEFFIENIEQDVPVKENQPPKRGIMPDYKVEQSFDDFLSNKDTQMEFAMKLISKG